MNAVARNNKITQRLVNDPKFKIQKNGKIRRVNEEGKYVDAPTFDGYNGRSKIRYKGKNLFISRVVYAAFGKEPLSDKKVIDHKNSDPTNNSISNLQQITQKQNVLKKTVKDRFTKRQLTYMRRMFNAGSSFAAIARIMHRATSAVTHAIRKTRKGK